MAVEVEMRPGHCKTHGEVQATREVPRLQFPYVVNAMRRYLAKRRPFRCPTCGAPVETT
jgi:hypothetical protein